MFEHISRPQRVSVILLWLLAGMVLGQTDSVSPDNVLVPQSRSYGFSRCNEPTIRINGVKAQSFSFPCLPTSPYRTFSMVCQTFLLQRVSAQEQRRRPYLGRWSWMSTIRP